MGQSFRRLLANRARFEHSRGIEPELRSLLRLVPNPSSVTCLSLTCCEKA